MKVCVIGGGAAGMLASSMIAQNGHEVLLFEKNEKLGKKIYITGKGRCNVTNASTGNDFLKNIVHGEKFMLGAMSKFNSQDTMNFFEDNNCHLKIERGNRVFPISDKSSDIIKALERVMKNAGVKVFLNSKVDGIIVSEKMVKGIVSSGEKIFCDKVIVATGGITYPATGSTGDGYNFAEGVGHEVITPVQALCGIKLKNNDISSLEGLSLKNVKLYAKINDKIHFDSEIGEMLFTKNGISGPLILTASSFVNRLNFDNLKLFIDFKPALNLDELLIRINKDISNLKAKQISSLLENLLPKSLVSVFSARLKFDLKSKANQLTKEDRKALAMLLKHFELNPLELESVHQSVITSGGVSLKEINPKNMESKLISGLYFIGEVLDIDALTGGFNLQLAFSTAAAAAHDF